MPADNIIVKLDFFNAFNCLHRYDMLQSIADRVPELFPYCHSAYCKTRFFRVPFISRISRAWQVRENLNTVAFQCSRKQKG